jgi:hypothetical protein
VPDYLDTSALITLVRSGPESGALRAELEASGGLDALHLAAALSLGSDLERMYCYDVRLAAAATAFGLDVRAPA